ncbi:hypothetical protein K474DRAFT_1655704 [Panus rudis PR-1116 ss-1]|nr:hypothetical protein K474DRAFT_1655704 [Panus rudis PR-1116 ss-1]
MRFSIIPAVLFIVFSTAASGTQIVLDDMDHALPIDTPAFASPEGPCLADLLTIDSSVSIFYSYAREVEISKRFEDRGKQSTLLVPTNKAVMALARKPHQDPPHVDEGVIISEQEYDAHSKRNVERWIAAHIIPESPIDLTSQSYETLLKGKQVKFRTTSPDANPHWSTVTIDDDIHIVAEKKACNGVIYVIDGTVKIA